MTGPVIATKPTSAIGSEISFRQFSGNFEGSVGPNRSMDASSGSSIQGKISTVENPPPSPQLWDCVVTLQPTTRGIPGMASFDPGPAVTTNARLVISPNSGGLELTGLADGKLDGGSGDERVTGSLIIRLINRLDESLSVERLLADPNVALALCKANLGNVA